MCVEHDDPWKVHSILNSKGGVGKSFIVFLLAQYYRQGSARSAEELGPIMSAGSPPASPSVQPVFPGQWRLQAQSSWRPNRHMPIAGLPNPKFFRRQA
jgi:hypothetical protein